MWQRADHSTYILAGTCRCQGALPVACGMTQLCRAAYNGVVVHAVAVPLHPAKGPGVVPQSALSVLSAAACDETVLVTGTGGSGPAGTPAQVRKFPSGRRQYQHALKSCLHRSHGLTGSPIDRLSQKSEKYLKRRILALLTFSFPLKSKMRAHKISKTWGAKSKFRSQNLTTKLTQIKTARGSLVEISSKLPLKLLPNCLTLVSSFKVPKDKTATKLLFVFGGVFVDNTNTHGQSHSHIHTSASYILRHTQHTNTHTHTHTHTHQIQDTTHTRDLQQNTLSTHRQKGSSFGRAPKQFRSSFTSSFAFAN